MAPRRKNKSEFRPDPVHATRLKTMRLTQLQRLRLLKWTCYVLSIMLAIVLQDVVMSQIRIFGATTDLPVCVILLITVLEGTEVGSMFVLIASTGYFFSGTAPGAYSIGILCFLGIAVTMFRQMNMRRTKGSLVFAASIASLGYEVGICVAGVFQELTRWDRLPFFLITGLYNFFVLIAIYPLICKIGLIGGNTWKE